MSSTKKKDLESSLRNLTIDPSASPKPAAKSTKKSKIPVADSWEDEASSGEEEEEEEEADTPTAPSQTPSAPPPTPISPSSPDSKIKTYQKENLLVSSLWESSNSISPPRSQLTGHGDSDAPERRPEKTNAVANRMIAGALGIRAPKKTEEQKAYERAIQETERTKRDREREEKIRKAEEMEKAKKAIWDA